MSRIDSSFSLADRARAAAPHTLGIAQDKGE